MQVSQGHRTLWAFYLYLPGKEFPHLGGSACGTDTTGLSREVKGIAGAEASGKLGVPCAIYRGLTIIWISRTFKILDIHILLFWVKEATAKINGRKKQLLNRKNVIHYDAFSHEPPKTVGKGTSKVATCEVKKPDKKNQPILKLCIRTRTARRPMGCKRAFKVYTWRAGPQLVSSKDLTPDITSHLFRPCKGNNPTFRGLTNHSCGTTGKLGISSKY